MIGHYDPVKSCFKEECDWKNRCDLFRRPNASMHFAPTETAEFCHSYVPKFVPYGLILPTTFSIHRLIQARERAVYFRQ